MKEGIITKWIIILSAIFYISSLTQTAYCTTDCKNSLSLLFIGILGVLVEIGATANFIISKINGHTCTLNNTIGASFTWLANPLILFCFIVITYSKKTAVLLSGLSTIIILLFLVFDEVIDDEAGHYRQITEIKLGYWLWLLSSLTILIGSLTLLKIKTILAHKK